MEPSLFKKENPNRRISITIIIPVFNEENTVSEIINKVKKVNYPSKTEIIVVNDGSTDNTAKKLIPNNDIIYLYNKTNRGKGFAIRKALKIAKGNIILIQDADLEYNPQDHLKLLAILNQEFVDVVYGSRFLSQTHKPRYSLFYFGNIFLSYITKILFNRNITDMETCYKAFKKKVFKDISLKEDRFGFEPEITCKILKKGINIIEVPIKYKSRSFEEGKKIGIKDGLRAIYVLLKYRFLN